MFKFKFNNPEEAYDHEFDCKLDWYRSEEVTLDNISNSSTVKILSDNLSTFVIGELKLKIVSTDTATQLAVANSSENIVSAEATHSDLIPARYEGGLKTWECTRDLADFLVKSEDVNWKGSNVLDLGCGTGILGLIALNRGSSVVFQDYNKEVLELVTGPHVLLNVPDATCQRVQLFSGDWSNFLQLYKKQQADKKFDVILSSETIYNLSNYGKLHNVIVDLLAPTGVCYLAGKSVYFGVGGSMRAFKDFINKRNVLDVDNCWLHTEGVAREIFKITHKISK